MTYRAYKLKVTVLLSLLLIATSVFADECPVHYTNYAIQNMPTIIQQNNHPAGGMPTIDSCEYNKEEEIANVFITIKWNSLFSNKKIWVKGSLYVFPQGHKWYTTAESKKRKNKDFFLDIIGKGFQ